MGYLATELIKKFPSSVVQNITPPTFAGVTSVVANSDGSLTANWAAASGAAAMPIRYKVYAALGASVPAASLFVAANIVAEASSLWTKANFFQLGDQTTYFVNGQAYTVGVRAFSAENISETNTVTANVTAIASGNIGGQFQAIHVELEADLVEFETNLAIFDNLTDDAANITAAAVAIDEAVVELEASLSLLNNLSSGASDLNGFVVDQTAPVIGVIEEE